MRKIFILSIFLFPYAIFAQFTAQVDFGLYTATELDGESGTIQDFGLGAGYTFYENLHLLGGLKIQHVKYSATWFEDTSNERMNHDLFNVPLFVSLQYSIWGIKLKSGWLGLSPELRAYFSPLPPRKLDIEENSNEPPYPTVVVTKRAQYTMQLAYGIGVNLFYSPANKKGRLGLKAEWSNLDPYVAVRALEDFTTPKFLHIGVFLTLIDY